MMKRLRPILPFILLFFIILVGAYLRFYRLSEYMTFLGDEGRDALTVKRMIVDGKWTLLGPTASVGGFFMGPVYYYFMAPFLWLWKLDPVGPAVMVALVGTATIGLVYLVGRTLFGTTVGLVSSSLYAISPFIIAYSRSSWNPNIVPFFTLLAFFILWVTAETKKWGYLFFLGFILGIDLQLHYTVLFAIAAATVFIFLYRARGLKPANILMGLFGFIIGFSPFLAFELRHGFTNSRSILSFVFEGKDTGFSLPIILRNIGDVGVRLFGRLLLWLPDKGMLGNVPKTQRTTWIQATYIIALWAYVSLLVQCIKKQKEKLSSSPVAVVLTIVWIVVVFLCFGLYKKAIYDYYFGILYFIPFLLFGIAFAQSLKHPVYKYFGFAAYAGLIVLNIWGAPFRFEPNNQLGQTKLIANEVLSHTEGKPFNFALVSSGNSDHAYRYFFEIWGRSPVTIENSDVDPARSTVTSQLLVVCEDTSCQPVGNSLWEIAGFGRAEIAGVWDVSVVKVYRLIRYQGEVL